MTDVTSEGQRLIEDWLDAKAAVEQARDVQSRCNCTERNTEAALAKWLVPADAKPGEKIAVWFGDSLIQVEVGGVSQGEPGDGEIGIAPTETRVTVRTRGKHFSRLASVG